MKSAFIKESLSEHPVEICWGVLEVSRSGYYAWRDRPVNVRSMRREEPAEKIRTVHEGNRRVHGSPRIFRVLLARGEAVCENTVAKVMKQREIRAKTKRRFVPRTTAGSHANPVVTNVLDREFAAELPNRKWAADITCIPTGRGWLYPAGVHRARTKGRGSSAGRWPITCGPNWSVMRCGWRSPADSPMVRCFITATGGVQYTREDYMHMLQPNNMQPSVSGKGNCRDNAAMESFWATLKTELVNHQQYTNHEQARASFFEYIEVFYNRKRLHRSIGCVSPEAFEASLN